MKIKQILGFSFLAVFSALLLGSCGIDEPNPAPGIDIIAEGGSLTSDVTMDGDKDFTLVFSVSDDSKVETVEVRSVVNGRVSIQFDTTLNTASAKIKLYRKSYADIATEVWTIQVTDDKGSSSTKSFTITTTSSVTGDPLTSFEKYNIGSEPFKVWNFFGANTGAFNLVDGIPLTKNDPAAEKDIHDSTGTAEVTQWPGRLTSKNGTLFKKVTSYAYADVKNTGQLDAIWNSSGVEKKFMIVAAGDLYIANIKRTNQKILISIDAVVKTSGDNLDYIQFKFLKKTI